MTAIWMLSLAEMDGRERMTCAFLDSPAERKEGVTPDATAPAASFPMKDRLVCRGRLGSVLILDLPEKGGGRSPGI
jgi:hypothetical protein